MGNFEKLVVLVVLFLSAIVLAVSLNDDADEAGSSDPLVADRGESSATDENPAGTASPEILDDEDESRTEESTDRPGLLLDASVPTEPPAETEEPGETAPASTGPRRILVNDTDLTEAVVGDYMVYTVREGDTWAGLAQRFFHDTRYLSQLHSANEEMDTPLPGEDILIPVYDLSHDAGIRAPLRPAEPVARPLVEEPPVEVTSDTATEVYEVVSGDSLSEISEKVYGTATRWKEIFEANRDVLDGPDWVQVGMKLKIPR